jgi:hypothetical protein
LVARPLGIVHRLPTVGLGSYYIAHDIAAKHAIGMRDGERHYLLGTERQFDYPVKLGCTVAKMPSHTQGCPMEV